MFRAFTRLLANHATRPSRPDRTVAIVVPVSLRGELTPDEQISLRHLRHHLSRYDTFLIAPQGTKWDLPGIRTRYFPRKYFGSAAAHNHLTYSPAFYQVFARYRYVFFYHLDSLVFSDQLDQWCATGVDYIGPPWIRCDQTPWVTRPRVGNGGFTLLKVESALSVFRHRYRAYPGLYWLDKFARNAARTEPLVAWLKRLQLRFPNSKLIRRPIEEWEMMRDPSRNNRNNDVFWSDKAVWFLPSFRVASLEEGLEFAFEASPRTCLEMNGGRLPFGCHAWPRYDRRFWEPYLLKAREPSALLSAATQGA